MTQTENPKCEITVFLTKKLPDQLHEHSQNQGAEVDEDTGGLPVTALLRWKPQYQVLSAKNEGCKCHVCHLFCLPRNIKVSVSKTLGKHEKKSTKKALAARKS